MLSRRLLLALIMFIALCRPAFAAQPSRDGDFSLIDHDGNAWSLQDARGKLVLLQFGYTSCPDVCPTGLLSIQQVMQKLGDRAGSVQPLFVSVDPKRDTPDVLKAYVDYFHPSIIGLTGKPAILDDISQRYHTAYSYSGDAGSSDYDVNHSSSLYVIDAEGRLTNIVPYGTPADVILDNVNRLLTRKK